MCYFITATLSKKVDIQKIKPIFIKNNFDLSSLCNTSIINQINNDCNYFSITDLKKPCDCGTFLHGGLLEKYKKSELEKMIAKNKKKGWSDNKIQRWLKDKEDALIRGTNPVNSKKIDEIEKFIKFLRKIFSFKEVQFIGILKHMYKYDVENEKIKLKSIEEININKLDTEFFLSGRNIKDDILYKFHQ